VLAHVFRADLDTCVHCGGPMRWLEAATTEQAATALLAKLGPGSSASSSATTGFVRAAPTQVLLRL